MSVGKHQEMREEILGWGTGFKGQVVRIRESMKHESGESWVGMSGYKWEGTVRRGDKGDKAK